MIFELATSKSGCDALHKSIILLWTNHSAKYPPIKTLEILVLLDSMWSTATVHKKDMETPCATPLYCKRKATKFSYIQPQLLDLAHGVLKRKRS